MDKIIYLPHPVSAEDKRRWNADGFRIIDDRFKPESLKEADQKTGDSSENSPRRKTRRR